MFAPATHRLGHKTRPSPSSPPYASPKPTTPSTPSTRFHYRVTRERLQQLRQFKEENGHAFVPYKEPNGLGRWIAEQRYRYQRGLCDISIYRELSSAGVPLRAFEARWERRFQQLSLFHSQRGHAFIQNADTKGKGIGGLKSASNPDAQDDDDCQVEDEEIDEDSDLEAPPDAGLYAWVLQQRQLRKQGRLSEARRRRLDALGFVWDVQLHTWRENMTLLKAYYEEFGHVRVPKGWSGGPKLYLFTRKVQQSSKIDFADVPYASLEDIKVLRSMGAVRKRRKSWEARFEEYTTAIERGVEVEDGLKAWLRSQRYAFRQGTLDDERRRRLVAAGLMSAPRL